MSHLLVPAADLVEQLRDAIDPDQVAVVTADPERAAQAITGASDVVVLVGMPTIDWLTYNAADVEIPVHLIATTLDYMRAWQALDDVLEQLLDVPDLVPAKSRPATYRPTPASAPFPAITLTITNARD